MSEPAPPDPSRAAGPGAVHLGGGGSAQDESRLWQQMLGGCRSVLYWPFALRGPLLAGAESWLRGQLHALRVDAEVTMWTTLDGHTPAELDGADLLFVGGGNTFSLLDHVRRHGFLEPVRAFVRRGGRYYGGSAGAILATDSIAIAATSDADEVGSDDLAGLGLLSGYDLLPHWTDAQRALARDWSGDHGRPVLAVPEDAGVVVAGGAVRAVGPGRVLVIEPDVEREL